MRASVTDIGSLFLSLPLSYTLLYTLICCLSHAIFLSSHSVLIGLVGRISLYSFLLYIVRYLYLQVYEIRRKLYFRMTSYEYILCIVTMLSHVLSPDGRLRWLMRGLHSRHSAGTRPHLKLRILYQFQILIISALILSVNW